MRRLTRVRRVWSIAALAMAVAGTLTTAQFVGLPAASAVQAADKYPSWDDIQQAKNDETAKQQEIDQVKNLISGLEDDYLSKQQDAQDKLDSYNDALDAYSEGLQNYQSLSAQADQASQKAEESKKKAGALVAQMYRANGSDVSVQLLLSGDSDSSDLLYKLSALGQVTDSNYDIYTAAQNDQNVAETLARDAESAKDALAQLEDQAKSLYDEALDAQDAAQAALQEQNDNESRLVEQLAELEDTTAELVQQREDGIKKEKEEAAAAAAKKAAEAAAAAAAAAAAKQQSSSSSSSGSGTSSGGTQTAGSGASAPTSSGSWVTPTYGYISSGYGGRAEYTAAGFHNGADVANACGTPIYAAAAGTVVFAGTEPYRALDIVIQHSGGIATEYAHMSSILVSAGASVSKGQLIAYMGKTGQATGCHLHFSVYQTSSWTTSMWGTHYNTVNPVTFLSARGVTLGSG